MLRKSVQNYYLSAQNRDFNNGVQNKFKSQDKIITQKKTPLF